MGLISIVNNIKRLQFINLIKILVFKLKKKTKFKTTKNERQLSLYYDYLIKYNGYVIRETNEYYITNFKDNFSALVKLRKMPSSDFDVFYQVVESNEYLPVIMNYKSNFKTSLNYSLNIIDAGSNIGLTSLFFMNYFQKARIIAVEPDEDNFQIMNFNLSNKANFEFIKINGAVWSSNTKIKIVNDFRDNSNWSFRVEESYDSEALKAYTINHLMTENDFNYIDILKIDIEGSEKEVFTSEFSNLDFLNKTKCIAIEIHDEFDCRKEIDSTLKNYGFTIIREGELTIGINKNLMDLNI